MLKWLHTILFLLNHKLSIPTIASILVFGIFVIGLSFDDVEAKTTISEEKETHYEAFVRSDNFSSEEYSTLRLVSIPDDDALVFIAYTYSNWITGERSQGFGTLEKSLIYTGDLKKEFTVDINTADLVGLSPHFGNDGIISVHAIKDGNDYTEKEKEESQSCNTNEDTGVQTCDKYKEDKKIVSATVTGTMFGAVVEAGFFEEEKTTQKVWSNP